MITCFFRIYLFIFGCAGSLLMHGGSSHCSKLRATLCCGARASHCGGFSSGGAQALGAWASVVEAVGSVAVALERWLSRCGTQA